MTEQSFQLSFHEIPPGARCSTRRGGRAFNSLFMRFMDASVITDIAALFFQLSFHEILSLLQHCGKMYIL